MNKFIVIVNHELKQIIYGEVAGIKQQLPEALDWKNTRTTLCASNEIADIEQMELLALHPEYESSQYTLIGENELKYGIKYCPTCQEFGELLEKIPEVIEYNGDAEAKQLPGGYPGLQFRCLDKECLTTWIMSESEAKKRE